jgi:hypothetical protein
MKTRKLITGKRVPALDKPLSWTFESKCPDKWVHVDCENGRIYVANSRLNCRWKEATLNQTNAAIKALQNYKRNCL